MIGSETWYLTTAAVCPQCGGRATRVRREQTEVFPVSADGAAFASSYEFRADPCDHLLPATTKVRAESNIHGVVFVTAHFEEEGKDG